MKAVIWARAPPEVEGLKLGTSNPHNQKENGMTTKSGIKAGIGLGIDEFG